MKVLLVDHEEEGDRSVDCYYGGSLSNLGDCSAQREVWVKGLSVVFCGLVDPLGSACYLIHYTGLRRKRRKHWKGGEKAENSEGTQGMRMRSRALPDSQRGGRLVARESS